MMMGMQWLLTGMSPGDSLVFTYSGHGSRQKDYSGEELDGYNETLVPLDSRVAGEIVDDELNHRLINPLPSVSLVEAEMSRSSLASTTPCPTFLAAAAGGQAACRHRCMPQRFCHGSTLLGVHRQRQAAMEAGVPVYAVAQGKPRSVCRLGESMPAKA